MANILDYIKWRGDIPLTAKNFNEVDNLIFSVLVYVHFGKIVPEINEDEYIILSDAVEHLKELYTSEEIETSTMFNDDLLFLIDLMAKSERYKNLRLLNYANILNKNEVEQFRAITIELDRTNIVVSYSGTDMTLTGWRENFDMSFKCPVPAQKDAVEYLSKINRFKYRNIILTGHSKGGNLAIYAASMTTPKIQKKIKHVYSNDGPGFRQEFLNFECYKLMKPKITTIVPENSFIGVLLDNDFEYTVIESNEKGINAHNAFSWQIIGRFLEHRDELGKKGKFFDTVTTDWLADKDDEIREHFVDSFFYVLESAEIETLNDLKEVSPNLISNIIKNFNTLEPEMKQIIYKVLISFLSSGNKYRIQNLKETSPLNDKLKNKINNHKKASLDWLAGNKSNKINLVTNNIVKNKNILTKH